MAQADAKTDQRLESSRKVFESFSNLTEQAIPTWLLERAYGIVVVPGVVKVALSLGGRGGRGVMAVRNPDGSWSDPVFVTLAGVNFGLQFGVQSTDVVLVLMSRQSVEGISGGKVTLGGDASVAAGPLGRSASANTDATFKAQVLSYSRSEGLFAGVALDGSVIAIDDGSNATAYGVSGVLPSQILEGKIASAPQAALDFKAALTRATTAATATTPPTAPSSVAVGAAAAEPATPPAAPASAAPEAGATTYPMEDPNPGAPPPK
ncbi:MAG TPA: lipid-binding SYLF domain-containing protein [Steroidobacteraceae bacterium]